MMRTSNKRVLSNMHIPTQYIERVFNDIMHFCKLIIEEANLAVEHRGRLVPDRKLSILTDVFLLAKPSALRIRIS